MAKALEGKMYEQQLRSLRLFRPDSKQSGHQNTQSQRHNPSTTLLKISDPTEVRHAWNASDTWQNPAGWPYTLSDLRETAQPSTMRNDPIMETASDTAQSQAWDTEQQKIRLHLFQHSWNNVSFSCYSPEAAALTWKLLLWHIGLLSTSRTSREHWASQQPLEK